MSKRMHRGTRACGVLAGAAWYVTHNDDLSGLVVVVVLGWFLTLPLLRWLDTSRLGIWLGIEP